MSTIAEALAHTGPALIDLVIDPNALSLPSHLTEEQVKGCALAPRRSSWQEAEAGC